MQFKEFLKVIDHRFRNAREIGSDVVQADIINWADEVIGQVKYKTGTAPVVLGIECNIQNAAYRWGENISETPCASKSLSEICSILRGLLESRNQVEIITDTEANVLIASAKQNVPPITSVVESYKNNKKEYHVTINATFSCVVNSTTMDHALAEFKDRLKFPDNIQYMINDESVEIKYK